MNEIIFLVQEAAEGGYEARALSESIFTEADTLPELREMVHDAVACHFEDEGRPSVIRLRFVRDEVLAAQPDFDDLLNMLSKFPQTIE